MVKGFHCSRFIHFRSIWWLCCWNRHKFVLCRMNSSTLCREKSQFLFRDMSLASIVWMTYVLFLSIAWQFNCFVNTSRLFGNLFQFRRSLLFSSLAPLLFRLTSLSLFSLHFSVSRNVYIFLLLYALHKEKSLWFF